MSAVTHQAAHSPNQVFHRVGKAPILEASQWGYPAHTVFSPAAARLPDGDTVLLCRVEDFTGRSHFAVARSKDGITDWSIEERPSLVPAATSRPEESWGIEDPRITYLAELGQYMICYTSFSNSGTCLSLASTTDFDSFYKRGIILAPPDRHGALFPQRIRGRYALLHRPDTKPTSDIWISYSDDLTYWGDPHVLLPAYRRGHWDSEKVSIGPPPMLTEQGWLVIYHGTHTTSSGSVYRMGLALLDVENPEVCIHRSPYWFFGPEAPYERSGNVANVVFSCGAVIGDDGDTLNMYYGCADTSIGLAQASIKELLAAVRQP